jgi:hypothetical protein
MEESIEEEIVINPNDSPLINAKKKGKAIGIPPLPPKIQ